MRDTQTVTKTCLARKTEIVHGVDRHFICDLEKGHGGQHWDDFWGPFKDAE
jgi:hypothetical protein